MSLSIVIPAYNVEKYLDDCLLSCVNQDIEPSDYEILIINDGSTDTTLETAQRWASEYSCINVISQPNRGLSMARNAGIEASSGDYIMFVDSDDMIRTDSLSSIHEKCMKDNLDMLRIGAADILDGRSRKRFRLEDMGICKGREMMKQQFQVCAPFAIYKREFLDRHSLRFLPGILHEDNLFTPTAYYLADKAASYAQTIYYVRQRPGSITRSANPQKSIDLLKVADLLAGFSAERVENGFRKYFDKQIADCLNGCFKNALCLEDKDREMVSEAILMNKDLFRHFRHSSALTHRIEGVVLEIFPKHALSIYRVLELKRYFRRK